MRFVLVIAALLLTAQVISASPDVFIPLLPEQREKLLALFRSFTRRLSSAVTDDTILKSRRGKYRRKKWKRRPKRSADEYTLDSGEHEQFRFFNSELHEPNFLTSQIEDTKFKEQFRVHEFYEQRRRLPLTRRNKRSRSRNALSKRRKNIWKNKRKNKNLSNHECLKTLGDKRVRKGFLRPKLVDTYGISPCFQQQDGHCSDTSQEIDNQFADLKIKEQKQAMNLNRKKLKNCIHKKDKFGGRKYYSEVEDSSKFGTSDTNYIHRFKAYPTTVSYDNYALRNAGSNENHASPNSKTNIYRDKIIKYNSREPFLTSNPTPIYSDRNLLRTIDKPINSEMLDFHIDDRNYIMASDTFPEINNYNNKQQNKRVLETAGTSKISRKNCQHSNKKSLENFPSFGCHDLSERNSKSSQNIGQQYSNRRHNSRQEVYDDTHTRLPHRVHSLLTLTNPITFWDPPQKDEYEHISTNFSLKSIYDFLKQGIRTYRIVKDYLKRGWPFVYR